MKPLTSCLVAAAVAVALTASPTAPRAIAQATPNPAAGERNAVNLPALGDATSEDLPVAAERRVGDRIMREARRDPDVLDDPLLLEYVQSLWQPLVGAARARGDIADETNTHFAWETFLVRDRTVNAFALPGGYVGVHLGLISLTGTRDELASVLAHELSHVTQRHIARSLAVQKRQSLVGLAAMILGVMAASRSPDAANAAIATGQAAMIQGQLNFSRDMEREADRIGALVLAKAGFDGAGMVGMFEKLQLAARLNDFNQFPYLRSHPLTTERIGEARARLGLPGATIRPANVADAAMLHAAMQGRARALMDPRGETLQRLMAATPEASGAGASSPAGMAAGASGAAENLTGAYAAALAATRVKRWPAADAAIARARTLAAPYPAALRAVLMLQAESLIERGQAAQAADLVDGSDGSRAGLLLAARAALGINGPAAGLRRQIEALQTWVALYPNDASAWTLLGRAYERTGQTLPSVRAQAEAQLALGDVRGASDRLRAGQRLARRGNAADSIEASVIDARLKDVEGLRRRLQDEERQAREL